MYLPPESLILGGNFLKEILSYSHNSLVIKVTDNNWTELETEIAQRAFKIANERETKALIQYASQRASEIKELEELWQFHDFLSSRRHEIEGKYDYRLSVLLFVFAELLRDGWLNLDDLTGLEAEKLTKIAALAKMV